jgi:hypothetical protein
MCILTENAAVGIRHADHVAPFYPQKLALTSPTSGGSSVGQSARGLRPWSFMCIFNSSSMVVYLV